MKAIELCVSRFDDDTRAAFTDLYTKIDADVNAMSEEVSENGPLAEDQEF
jgi:hypothetical protein